MTTIELRSILENAPKNPGPQAPELIGWESKAGQVWCAHCVGRAIARGFGPAFRECKPMYTSDSKPCEICNAPLTAH